MFLGKTHIYHYICIIPQFQHYNFRGGLMNSFIQNKDEVKKLLLLAMSTGEALLKNGAETYRVEDSMNRICNSKSNVSNVDSFVTHTGLFLTLEFEGEVYTNLRRVKKLGYNLNKVSLINDFSRKFIAKDICIEEGLKEISNIVAASDYHKFIRLLSVSLASSFFSLMFGGDITDYISSIITSFLTLTILEILSNQNLGFFLDCFLGASLASIFSHISLRLGLCNNVDIVIIGSIMCLVPGIPITNSIRDTMSGDSLSGLSKGMEAIFSALAIAFGVGLILNLHMKGLV